MELEGVIPDYLKIWWLIFSPLAAPFTLRILWEKTVWTWTRGPQAVGFSLIHIHPLFALSGMAFSFAVVVWLVPAAVYAIWRRKDITPADVMMILYSVFLTTVLLIPDNFFAS